MLKKYKYTDFTMNDTEVCNEIQKALDINSETELVEFKDASGGFPKTPVRKTLSAFGNTKGGVIVFGVREKEDNTLEVVSGIDIAGLQEAMTTLSSNEMNKVLRLKYHICIFGGKQVLAVYVPECENHSKPYYFEQVGMPKGAYIRDGNTDRQMTDEEMKSFVRNAQVDDFDSGCTDTVEREDLSFEKIEDFLKRSSSKTGRDFKGIDDSVLKNIGVLTNQCSVSLKPTIAGFLIFAKENPQNKLQFERYKIRCIRYKGSGVASDILDKADITGTLDEQIDSMQIFILRNIKKSAKIVGTKRVERYEYPEAAIREIVANAVIHRDYRITETYTQVNIFEDRIEVFNPGNLPPGVTVDNIKTSQVSRNRIIAARLNEMDYMEEYGRGIGIVISKMDEWGLLPPIFKNTANSFRVILPGEKLSQLNDRQVKIWEYLTDNQKVTRKEAEGILVGTPSQTINHDLRKMKEVGLIQQEGQSSNIYYKASF